MTVVAPKLFVSSTSPFARKVIIVADVLGLISQIELITAAPHPIDRDGAVVAHNPLGKVPTLITAEGAVLFDSRVITEYLDAQSGGLKVYPKVGPQRWKALALQAVGDGLLDAALLARYEFTVRPNEKRWQLWYDRQFDKISSSLDTLERQADQLSKAPQIGEITLACALGYLDLRFPDFDWRVAQPRLSVWFREFSELPSFTRTSALLMKAA